MSSARSFTVVVAVLAAVAAVATGSTAGAATNTTEAASTAPPSTAPPSTDPPSTMEPTTTTLHTCEVDAPCGPNSVCHEDGSDHVCVCNAGFTGMNSTDGDGCTRPSLSTVAVNNKIGMLVNVGEGADLHLRAGGSKRGRSASILAMVDSIEDLVEAVDENEAGIAEAMDAIGRVNAKVDSTKTDLATEIGKVSGRVDTVMDKNLPALSTSVQTNTDALAREVSRAKTTEASLGTRLSTEAQRALKAESDLKREIRAYFTAAGLSRNCAEVAKNHPHAQQAFGSATFTVQATIYPGGSVLAPSKKVWCSITPPRKVLSGTNLARRRPTSQASTCSGGSSGRAVDGSTNGYWGSRSTSHTCRRARNDWWRVDLGKNVVIKRISVYNRIDCCWTRLASAQVRVSTSSSVVTTGKIAKLVQGSFRQRSGEIRTEMQPAVTGRWVAVVLTGSNYLQLAEVRVFAESTIAAKGVQVPGP